MFFSYNTQIYSLNFTVLLGSLLVLIFSRSLSSHLFPASHVVHISFSVLFYSRNIYAYASSAAFPARRARVHGENIYKTGARGEARVVAGFRKRNHWSFLNSEWTATSGSLAFSLFRERGRNFFPEPPPPPAVASLDREKVFKHTLSPSIIYACEF